MRNDPSARPDFDTEPIWRTIAELTLPAAADYARRAALQVTAAVQALNLPPARLEQLADSVSDAVHKAVSHSRQLQANWPLQIKVSVLELTDQCAACCWGFFLITKTADRLHETGSPAPPVIEVFLYQERESLRM
jgi:hypothetical protein